MSAIVRGQVRKAFLVVIEAIAQIVLVLVGVIRFFMEVA